MYQQEASIGGAPTTDKSSPKVAILMGTYNGERFLAEQLDSIKKQTHTNWELHVSDDGSTDSTQSIINDFKAELQENQLTLRHGPKKGFATNFLSLACDQNIQADYYAFSDQDDVWESDKIERALNWLKTMPIGKPTLYCSRTQLIDEHGNEIGLSPLFKRKPSFKNALVQSIAGANTMVLNHSARALLAKSGNELSIVSHDWWMYLLVSGCSGTVHYDPVPTIKYRQHEHNLVGSNNDWSARSRRILASLHGRFRAWNNINISALRTYESSLNADCLHTLQVFEHSRTQPLLSRIAGFMTAGVYRQTFLGSLSLATGAILAKI